jgi:hypothetical protein
LEAANSSKVQCVVANLIELDSQSNVEIGEPIKR